MNGRLWLAALACCAALLVGGATGGAAAEELTGRQIMENVDKATKANDTSQIISIVVERGEQKLSRRVRGLNKKTPWGEKDLMTFELPEDVKNIKYLTWNYTDPAQRDDMWVYMPSEKLVRRISGGGMKAVFMRSDLYNEDMKTVNLDDDDYELLRGEKCGETTCHVVQRVKKDQSDTNYARRVVWVRGDIWQPVKVEYFDKKNRLVKTAHMGGFQQIQGYWTRTKMLVTPTHGQSRTILLFSEIQYDLGLADELFEHAELTK